MTKAYPTRSVRSIPEARGKVWSIAANALLVFASLSFSIAVLEVAFRVFPQYQVPTGEGDFVFCTTDTVRYRTHELFGYVEKPGASYFERYTPADSWSYIQVNAEGFRDNYDHEEAVGETVIILGDSMTRGSLVNEYETYTSFLRRWQPEISFRNYGVGGFAQANSIRIYEEKAPELTHRLVIDQYSLGNDLNDNTGRAVLDGDSVKIVIEPAIGTPKDQVSLAVRIHLFFWRNSKTYPWFYTVVLKPFTENWDVRTDLGDTLELTRRLLVRLADDVRANQADLLLVVLPAWAEMVGRDDGMEPARQREMLQALAAKTPGLYLLDMTPAFAAEDPKRIYGVVDKHLTPYGHFLVASAIDRWMLQEWPLGRGLSQPERRFHPGPLPVPDCGMAPVYQMMARDLHGRF